MFNKRIIVISVVSLLSGSLIHSWPSEQTVAKTAVAAGCVGVAGLIGYTYYKNQPSEEERADRELKADLESKIFRGPVSVAARIKLKEFECLAYEDREKLLPAVIAVNNHENLLDLLQQAYAGCLQAFEAHQKSLSDAEQKVLHSEEPIALSAILISRHEAHNHRDIDCLAQQNPQKLFIKNVTNPRVFLGRPLRPGECAIIGYSDGDIQIRLHDSDRRLLNELSLEKRDFIKSLAQHPRNPEGLELDSAETVLFYSLPSEMRNCLSKNYQIKTIGGVAMRNTEIVLCCALGIFNLAQIGKLIYEGKYIKSLGRYFATTFFLGGLHGALNSRRPFNLLATLGATASVEALFNGHFILEKLGKQLFPPKNSAANA